MTELELVCKFKEAYEKKFKESYVIIPSVANNQSKQADLEVYYEQKKYIVEAKVFNDTRNKSNNFLIIFGKVLNNRNLKEDKSNMEKYGLLFAKNDIVYIKKKLEALNERDLIDFGLLFELEKVFIYDGEADGIEIQNWQEFAINDV